MEDHIGWLITSSSDGDTDRVGYGQCIKLAEQTAASFAVGIFRQIYLETDLKPEAIPYERRVQWRSFSDDGEPGYNGVVDINWLYAPNEWAEEHHDMAYQVDQFCMNDIGAVSVLYNAADIRRCRPDLAEHVAKHPRISRESERGKWFLSNAKVDPAAWLEIYS